VIGVVSDIRQSLTRPPAPEVYVPVAQDRVLSFVLVARAVSGDALQLATAVRSAIETADRDIPITRVMTLDERIGENVTQPRFTAALMTAMAVLAVLLAAAGVFAVVSYSVAERRREFGIRMAMGATSARVLRQVLRESVVLALVAAAAGSVGATLSTGLIESLLFDVSATDPPVYAGVGLAILLVSVGAGLAPALRATSLDPLVVLREE
jgi:putative ABC transport system permease protein